MQCHTIKIAKKLSIYIGLETIAVVKSIRGITVKLQETIKKLSYKRR